MPVAGDSNVNQTADVTRLTNPRTMSMRPSLIPLFIGLAALPIYLLRLDGTAGMMGDDAWYILLAKSLADGHGYWLTNAPLAGILPQYPPGFPALLSLVFQLHPEFPGNVWLLKSVSIAAMPVCRVADLFYLMPSQLPLISLGLASWRPRRRLRSCFRNLDIDVGMRFTLTQSPLSCSHAARMLPPTPVRMPSSFRTSRAAPCSFAQLACRCGGVFFMLLKERFRSAALFSC